MPTSEDVTICDVFAGDEYFGDHDYKSMAFLSDEIEAENIEVLRVHLEEPDPAIDIRNFKGQPPHQWRCAMVATWFQGRNLAWVSERGYPGGRADIVCEAEKTAVECGYTKSDKVIRALSRGWSVMVVPYLGQPVIGYWFRVAPGRKVVDPLEEECRKIMENYHIPGLSLDPEKRKR